MNALTQMLMGLTDAATGAADAAATDAAAVTATAGVGEMLGMILPLVLMFVVFYFLLIRPQKKKDKKVKEMLAALKNGDRVCTIGGIYGTVDRLKDDTVTLLVGPEKTNTSIKDDTIELSVGRDNVKLVFARWAIRNVEEVAIENDSEVLN